MKTITNPSVTNEVVSPLRILYQDPYLVAVDKPSGLMVHRSWMSAHDEVFVMTLLRDQLGQLVYPLHRLDRQTDGVLLFALSSESARIFNALFEQQSMQKHYLAICRGFAPESIFVDHALREEKDKIADKFSKEREAMPAQTQFERLLTTELPIAVDRYATARYSLLKASPQTGRLHQIRKHLKHIRHPIVVDAKHGDRFHNQMLRANFDLQRLCLRAMTVSFKHPILQTQLVIEAGLTPEWLAILSIFNWHTQSEKIEHAFQLPTVNCPIKSPVID